MRSVVVGSKRWLWQRLALAALLLVSGMATAVSVPGAPADTASSVADPGAGAIELQVVPVPRLDATDAAVRSALEKARAELDARLAEGQDGGKDLADAFGSMGRLYHAHMVYGPARVCYENAALLDPGDYRWPYFLGYLAQEQGRLEAARAAFAAALRLNPELSVARLRLGQVELELGRWDEAERLLRSVIDNPGLRGAALFELGKLAYAQRDFREAARWLEEASAASPDASRIHYTLALTYRALGEVQQARDAMSRRGDSAPRIPDPLVESLESLSTGQRMLFHYGMDAGNRKEYAAAARIFREGLELEPENANARVSLARYLYLMGDHEAARAELDKALEQDPGNPLASFLLGLLYQEQGDDQAALGCYQKVLAEDASHAGAHFFVGEIEMQRGDYGSAARHFRATVQADPSHSAARLQEILAMILDGVSHVDVRTRLEEALQQDPQGHSFSYLLAALLSASPQPEARDGERALTLAKDLYDQYPSPEHAELLAMALAEKGDFAAAVQRQEEAVQRAMSANQWFLLPRLSRSLTEFTEGRPSRIPWDVQDLLGSERPVDTDLVFKSYPASNPF